MGMLEIRKSSARLESFGQFRMPELDNGSARAFAAHAEAAKSAAAAARVAGQATVEGISRRGQIVARTLGHLGRLAVDFAIDMRNREDESVVADALAKKSAWRQDQVAGNLDEGRIGIFDQKIDDPAKWQAQQKTALERINGDVTKNMTSRQRELFEKRNRMDDIVWDGRVAAHRAKTQMAQEVGKAAELEFNALREAAAAFSNPAAREHFGENYFKAVEKRLDAQMVPEALRAAERHKAAFALISAAEKAMITDWNMQTEAMTPEEARTFWNDAVDKAKKNGFVLDGRIREALGGSEYGLRHDGKTYKGKGWLGVDKGESVWANDGNAGLAETEEKLLLSRLEKARNEAVHSAEAREREANRAVAMDFTERELKLRDVPQELWADKYEEMGKDPTLRKADPKRAMAYMDAASEMRAAEKKAKEKASADAIKANEDRIYGQLIDFIYAKKFGVLSGQEAADAQAAVWRDFRVAVAGKAVGENFPDRFTARLDKELNDQQAEAMRYTMQLFGYDAETDSRGRVSAAERNRAMKDGQTFKTPFKVEGRFWDSQPTISASQLFDLMDRQWRLLEGADGGVSRIEAAKKMAEGEKEKWMHGGYNGMIEGMADDFMKYRLDSMTDEEYREAK